MSPLHVRDFNSWLLTILGQPKIHVGVSSHVPLLRPARLMSDNFYFHSGPGSAPIIITYTLLSSKMLLFEISQSYTLILLVHLFLYLHFNNDFTSSRYPIMDHINFLMSRTSSYFHGFFWPSYSFWSIITIATLKNS